MDRLDRLRTFVAVADQASFAAAARALRISPTAVTRGIAALEDSLGTALFRRTTRSVRLTDAGIAYLDRCRRVIIELDDAARAVAGADADPHGLLVVTAPMVFGRLHVLPIVAGLLRDHPRLDVRLTLTDRMVRLVEEGIDVAVRIADLSDSSLRAVRLAEVRRVLVASPVYLAAHGTPASVAALHGHALIASENLSPNNEWRFGPAGRQTLRFQPRLLTNSVDATIEAALLGAGITRALDYQVREHVAAGRLRMVLAEARSPPAPVSVLYCANRHPLPNVRAFVAAAKARFAAR